MGGCEDNERHASNGCRTNLREGSGVRSKSSKVAEGRDNLSGAPMGVPVSRSFNSSTGLREDPYKLVLEELYRKRQEIDSAIAAIEQVASPTSVDINLSQVPSSAASQEAHQPISAALLAVMRDLGGSARNGEIKAALNRSGYRFRGDPTVSVAQCLVRLANAGVVTKLDRGVWKLRPGAAEKVRF